MQNWRVVTFSVTTSVVLVTLYRLFCCSELSPGSSYLPLNETSRVRLAPVPLDHRLIDLNDFNFLTDNDCNGTSPFILILVHSAPQNAYNRDEIRRTWGKEMRVLFLLGETDLNLDEEDKRHGDLIRGTFRDSYRNMTYKHVMGLKWVSTKCPGAKYVLKTDDDVFVHTEALREWLDSVSPHGARNLMACLVERNAIVKRSFRSKWRVTPEEFPGRYYPDYCLGWVILYSPDVVQELYTESTKAPYFWIDDVLVTGILAEKANLTHLHLGDLAVSDERTVDNIAAGRHAEHFIFLLTTPDMFSPLARSIRSQIRGNS